ncbi:MAG: hypothetical protein AAB778_02595 [Patescibacteria group bacterium]
MEWIVWDENEEKRKRFPGLPWEHELNWSQIEEPKPGTHGDHMQKRMKMLIKNEMKEGFDPVVADEALRLASMTNEDLTIAGLVEKAREVIKASS